MRSMRVCEEGFEALGIFGGGRAVDRLIGQEATSVSSLQIQQTQIPDCCNWDINSIHVITCSLFV